MPIAFQAAEDTCYQNHLGSEQHEFDPVPTSSSSDNGENTNQSGVNTKSPNDEPPIASHQTNQPHSPLPVSENTAPHEGSHDTSPSCPDGGFQAWLLVLGSFCAQGVTFGLINTAAVFESYFKANQLKDYSNSEIGWIFSLYLFLVFFVGVQVGPVFDRHGPRLLLAGGSVCVVSSLMLLSISKSKWPQFRYKEPPRGVTSMRKIRLSHFRSILPNHFDVFRPRRRGRRHAQWPCLRSYRALL